MPMRPDVERQLLARLEDYDIRIEGSVPLSALQPRERASFTLSHPKASGRFVAIYLPVMTLTELSRIGKVDDVSHPLLVVGDHISERSAAAYREAGVQFLDRSGNAHLTIGDVHFDVRGRSRVHRDAPIVRTRDTNLFSPRRAQVIFALLVWRALCGSSLRAIANASGVSIGQVQSTMKLLEETGYLNNAHSRKLLRREELMDRWTAAYSTGLGPVLQIREFFGDTDRVKQVHDDEPLLIGGEAAVEGLLRPVSLTLYVEKFDPLLPAVNRWRTDWDPNIFLRHKFWSCPLPERHAPKVRGFARVPSLLVYADLMASDDSRLREAAWTLREQDAELRQM